MADNIPSADPVFDAWQRGLVTYVTTQADTRVADGETIRKLLKYQKLWASDYAASTIAMAVAHGTRHAKDDTRKAYEGLIRELIQRLEAVGGLDVADLRALGITAGSPSRR